MNMPLFGILDGWAAKTSTPLYAQAGAAQRRKTLHCVICLSFGMTSGFSSMVYSRASVKKLRPFAKKPGQDNVMLAHWAGNEGKADLSRDQRDPNPPEFCTVPFE